MVISLMAISCKTSKVNYEHLDLTFDGTVNLSYFGDKVESVEEALAYLAKKGGGTLVFETDKRYKIDRTLTIPYSNVVVDLNGATLDGSSLKDNESVISIGGVLGNRKVTRIISQNGEYLFANKMSLKHSTKWLFIESQELLNRSRKYYVKNEFVEVVQKKPRVTFSEPLLEYGNDVKVEEIQFVENTSLINGNIKCNASNRSNGIMIEKAMNCAVKGVNVNASNVSGININKSQSITVDSCKIISIGGVNLGLNYGVLFTRSQNCEVKNSYCKTLRTGIDQTISNNIVIQNNRTVGCGISPHAGLKISILNNVIKGSGIYMRASDSEIIGNEIYAENSGIGGITLAELSGKQNMKIENNKIYFPLKEDINIKKGDSYRIGIYSGELDFENISVIGNTIENADKGIYIFRADNAAGNRGLAVKNNNVINCKYVGIATHRYADQVIEGNVISGQDKTGIGIHLWESGGSFENISISNNKITNAKTGISTSKNYKKTYISKNEMKRVSKRRN